MTQNSNALIKKIALIIIFVFSYSMINTIILDKNKWLYVLFVFTYLLLLFLILKKETIRKYCTKCKISKRIKFFCWFIVLIPIVNIVIGMTFQNNYLDAKLSNYFFLLVYLFSAICEEIFFRAFLSFEIENYINNKQVLVIVSSVIFALFHLFSNVTQGFEIAIINMVFAYIMGYALALIFISTNNIIIPITLHYLINVTTFDDHLIESNKIMIYGYIAISLIIHVFSIITTHKEKETINETIY